MKLRKSAAVLIVLGIILIAAALLICVYNFYMDDRARSASTEVLDDLIEIIDQNAESAQDSFDNASEEPSDIVINDGTSDAETDAIETNAIEIDGNLYIGVLTIPSLELQLPVLKEWSYPNLRIAPCRYYGNAENHNLIIAAHNYRAFFKELNTLNSGDTIIFTNAVGFTREYTVVYTELVNGSAADRMRSESEDWDITLFTCTWSGRSRVTVRAEQVKSYWCVLGKDN